MPNRRNGVKQLGNRIDAGVVRDFKSFCSYWQVTQRDALETALKNLMRERGKPETRNPNGQI